MSTLNREETLAFRYTVTIAFREAAFEFWGSRVKCGRFKEAA